MTRLGLDSDRFRTGCDIIDPLDRHHTLDSLQAAMRRAILEGAVRRRFEEPKSPIGAHEQEAPSPALVRLGPRGGDGAALTSQAYEMSDVFERAVAAVGEELIRCTRGAHVEIA